MTDHTFDPQLNFLRQRKKSLSEIEKSDRKYALWMSYLLGGLLFLLLLVTIANFFFTRRLQSLQQSIEQTTAQIAEQNNIEQQYVILAEKLAFISGVIKDRSTKRSTIEFFTSQFSTAQTTLKEITYDQKGSLQFQVIAQDVFTIDSILKTLQSEEIRAKYQSIHLSDLSRTPDGMYAVTVTVAFANTSVPEE